MLETNIPLLLNHSKVKKTIRWCKEEQHRFRHGKIGWETKNRQVKKIALTEVTVCCWKNSSCVIISSGFFFGFFCGSFTDLAVKKLTQAPRWWKRVPRFLLLEGRRSEIRKRGKEFRNGLNSEGRKRPSLSYYHPKKGHFH